MSGYLLPVTCGHCGGELDPIATGRPVAGTETSAISRCSTCGREWQVLVYLRRLPNPESLRRQRTRRRAAPVPA